jgi:putative acetyltransferase
MALTFHCGELDSADVEHLVELHYAELRAISPPDACHVLPAVSLRDPAVTLWAARDNGELVGVARSRSWRRIMAR